MSGLFDKLKKMQKENQEAPVAESVTPEQIAENSKDDPTGTTPTLDTLEQCACGAHLSGECHECNTSTSGDPSVMQRLQAIGDQRQVNPPTESEAEPVPKHFAYLEKNQPEETKDEKTSKAGTQCPYCQGTYAVIKRHRCKKQPPGALQPWQVLEAAIAQAEEGVENSSEPTGTKDHGASPTLDPTDQMDPVHEDERMPTADEVIASVVEESAKVFEEVETRDKPMDIPEGATIITPEVLPIPEPGYTLFIDCVHYFGTDELVTDFVDIVPSLAAQVAREFQVPAWGMVDYGKGPSRLAQLLEGWLEDRNPSGVIKILSGSAEYRACRDVLIRRAKQVIMGVM